jgi:hypothetical protein
MIEIARNFARGSNIHDDTEIVRCRSALSHIEAMSYGVDLEGHPNAALEWSEHPLLLFQVP